MPGAPIMHGYRTSAPAQGEGGAARVAAASVGFTNASWPSNISFYVWLVVIGVLIPALIVGSLRLGGFHFVFKGRR